MAESYEHLSLVRETKTTERRRPQRPGMAPDKPADPKSHAKNVRKSFEKARGAQDSGEESQDGYDSRYLFKFRTQKIFNTSALNSFANIKLVSEEDDTICLVFVSRKALDTFRRRLREMEEGEEPAYQHLLWALQEAGNWTAIDRTGPALAATAMPKGDEFVLDIELWSLLQDREIRTEFEKWCEEHEISKIDDYRSANLILYRLRVNRDQADLLLHHRDVRQVDLPPRYGIRRSLLGLDIDGYPTLKRPPGNAAKVAVLDSGITTAHPLLESAIGEAESYVAHESCGDSTGHGTAVAGIVLWGNVEDIVEAQEASPLLWVLSGKVLHTDDYDEPIYDREFIEKQVTRAVEYFTKQYDCRVFNISFGDRNHPYTGGRLGSLAVTLDELARRHDILFVIATGNFTGTVQGPQDWHGEYPDYLLSEEARLLDPATALNGITVGSCAHHEATFSEQRRYLGGEKISGVPIAKSGQPSPFTRSGFSVGDAMKPELIEVGGNTAVSHFGLDERGLGRVTASKDFLGGKVLCEKSGTSFAAPYVSHLAGRLFTELESPSTNLVRALLVANAEPLPASKDLLEEEEYTRICGYGSINDQILYRSGDNAVALVTESSIADDQNHFYTLPIPPEYWRNTKGQREITVALSYMPAVRSTRKNYKATKLDFRLVRESSIQKVRNCCDHNLIETEGTPDELATGRAHSNSARRKGTVQCCTWTFQRATKNCRNNSLFVVVRRNDHSWATDTVKAMEDYALVVIVRDREREDAQLYTRIQAILRARARGRS